MSEQATTPVWFITGCSTGFGREMAELALSKGFRVAVTSRNPDDIKDIVASHPDLALSLALDVTDQDQVRSAVKAAEDRFGRIDVLVNNAGYGYMSAIEEGEDAQVRKLFETNYFGLLHVTVAALPGMRARHSGTIVNFSSIGGLTSFPVHGFYHSTKFAVEGMSGSLAQEVAPLGIKVIVVEPGPFRTEWSGASIKESETHIADYDETAGKRREAVRANSGKQVGDPARAAQAVLKAVESPNPPLHLVLGKPALELAYKHLEEVRADLDAWKETSLAADFPAGQ